MGEKGLALCYEFGKLLNPNKHSLNYKRFIDSLWKIRSRVHIFYLYYAYNPAKSCTRYVFFFYFFFQITNICKQSVYSLSNKIINFGEQLLVDGIKNIKLSEQFFIFMYNVLVLASFFGYISFSLFAVTFQIQQKQ